MRICLLALNDPAADPRARALDHSLRACGHDVVAVGVGRQADAEDGSVLIPSRVPQGRGLVRRVLRRCQPSWLRGRLLRRRLVRAAAGLAADVYYPTSPRAIAPASAAAAQTGATVLADPRWPEPDHRLSLVWQAPSRPELAAGPAGEVPRLHVPGGPAPSNPPRPGRHEGRSIALTYRRTERSPGRYLEAALRRAGLDVFVGDGGLDWGAVPDDAVGAVIVESPFPPLEITGANPGVPVAFWVHHGEHHVPANLRLVDRYGVDVVLLAHSWHLAHRFPVPVERFPFALAPEVFAPGPPHVERDADVAFVGSHIAGTGAYDARGRMLEQVRRVVSPERLALIEGVPPEGVAEAYRGARMVLNEGGRRHRPITMRVFEAIGAGALLVTEDAPGLDVLFERGEEFVAFGDGDAGAVVGELLADVGRTQAMAERARRRAEQRHTYDHRVDELLGVLAAVPRRRPSKEPQQGHGLAPLAALVANDVDVQRILTDDPTLAEALPDREVWELERRRDRLAPRGFEAVVVTSDAHDDLVDLVGAARRFVYAAGPVTKRIEPEVRDRHPEADVEVHAGGLLRADLKIEGYRLHAL